MKVFRRKIDVDNVTLGDRASDGLSAIMFDK